MLHRRSTSLQLEVNQERTISHSRLYQHFYTLRPATFPLQSLNGALSMNDSPQMLPSSRTSQSASFTQATCQKQRNYSKPWLRLIPRQHFRLFSSICVRYMNSVPAELMRLKHVLWSVPRRRVQVRVDGRKRLQNSSFDFE